MVLFVCCACWFHVWFFGRPRVVFVFLPVGLLVFTYGFGVAGFAPRVVLFLSVGLLVFTYGLGVAGFGFCWC